MSHQKKKKKGAKAKATKSLNHVSKEKSPDGYNTDPLCPELDVGVYRHGGQVPTASSQAPG